MGPSYFRSLTGPKHPIFSTLSIAPLAFLVVAGCTASEFAASGNPPHKEITVDPLFTVGPAPLRRLTNEEYLNALGDIFPAQHPTIPDLPADLTVAGFDNAAEAQQPSDVRVARYEAIASAYAEAATVDTAAVTALTGCADWSTAPLATSCATEFIDKVGSRLFRRPLASAERDRFLMRFEQWQEAVDFEGAVRLTLSVMLQAPQFVYRAEPVPRGEPLSSVVAVEPYAMASRLSFFLWASVPDDRLLAAASRDELRTEEQIRSEADRLFRDDRARRVLWSFHRQWLSLDRILLDEHLSRTPDVDGAWTDMTQVSAYEESRLFVENVLSQGGTFRDLLTSRRAWVNGEMARVYGLPPPADPTGWTEVSLPETERAGLLTRASFLAGFAHRGATSPPVRGNGIQLRWLCQMPTSPPPGVDLSQPMATPDQGPQTNRMLFETRTRPAACQTCHAALNGFGFGLENYDAAGHYRTSENGLPIDATGAIHGTDVDGPFDGGVALSEALSRSASIDRCASDQWFRYAFGRAPVDVEMTTVEMLAQQFRESGGDVRALLTDVTTSPSFRLRRVEED
jgi:hypothetical protein